MNNPLLKCKTLLFSIRRNRQYLILEWSEKEEQWNVYFTCLLSISLEQAWKNVVWQLQYITGWEIRFCRVSIIYFQRFTLCMHINIYEEKSTFYSLGWFPQTIPDALQKIQPTMSKLIGTHKTRNYS